MEDNVKEELEELIEEGEKQSTNIKYSSGVSGGGVYISGCYYIENKEQYFEWLEACYYWVSINNESSLQKIKTHYDILIGNKMKTNEHPKLLGSLKAMLKYPQTNKRTMNENKKEYQPSNVFNINQSQNQSQEQTQSQRLIQEVFLEAIKDDLTGKQQKELRAILDEHKEDIEKAKPKLVNKILSFGKDVASNILANILTNPNMLGHF